MEKETKKLYNPFKMWGSWVGIPFGGLLGFMVAANSISPESLNEIFWQYMISGLIIGFLFGWGVHSIFRKLR
jgi:hypothetical protein